VLTLTQERANDLLWRFAFWYDAACLKNSKNARAVERIVQGSVGDIRNILSLLLWLNQPKLSERRTLGAK